MELHSELKHSLAGLCERKQWDAKTESFCAFKIVNTEFPRQVAEERTESITALLNRERDLEESVKEPMLKALGGTIQAIRRGRCIYSIQKNGQSRNQPLQNEFYSQWVGLSRERRNIQIRIEEYRIWGLSINFQKTEYMCIGKNATDLQRGTEVTGNYIQKPSVFYLCLEDEVTQMASIVPQAKICTSPSIAGEMSIESSSEEEEDEEGHEEQSLINGHISFAVERVHSFETLSELMNKYILDHWCNRSDEEQQTIVPRSPRVYKHSFLVRNQEIKAERSKSTLFADSSGGKVWVNKKKKKMRDVSAVHLFANGPTLHVYYPLSTVLANAESTLGGCK
ncbi:hypothetical protein C0J52_26181 [Blattella germanica]|nr:hypothetical protein C0J52_26181 [Blattella germanica]